MVLILPLALVLKPKFLISIEKASNRYCHRDKVLLDILAPQSLGMRTTLPSIKGDTGYKDEKLAIEISGINEDGQCLVCSLWRVFSQWENEIRGLIFSIDGNASGALACRQQLAASSGFHCLHYTYLPRLAPRNLNGSDWMIVRLWLKNERLRVG